MHNEVLNFVSNFSTTDIISVIEIGSRDINGSVRQLFPNATWLGLDLYPGPSVNIVCDAEHFIPPCKYDIAVCCEVLEHAENWIQLINTMERWLKPDGKLIITCAGIGRAEHSAIDGQELKDGEYYKNLSELDLLKVMRMLNFGWIEASQVGQDVRAVAYKTLGKCPQELLSYEISRTEPSPFICREHAVIARHILSDLAIQNIWESSLPLKDYSYSIQDSNWSHTHNTTSCDFDKYVIIDVDNGTFVVTDEFIRRCCYR